MESNLNNPTLTGDFPAPPERSASVTKPIAELPASQRKRWQQQRDEQQPHWFAMRATYRAELSMKEKLEDKGLQCFVPLIIKEKLVMGKRKRYWGPAINSLIFVHGIKQDIQDFKTKEPRLQYQCRKTLDGHNTPIIVPDDQMQAFLRLYDNGNCEIKEIKENFSPGQRVRIISGPFEGMEGTFQRIKGHREKRFVVAIKGIALISTAEVEPDMVQSI